MSILFAKKYAWGIGRLDGGVASAWGIGGTAQIAFMTSQATENKHDAVKLEFVAGAW